MITARELQNNQPLEDARAIKVRYNASAQEAIKWLGKVDVAFETHLREAEKSIKYNSDYGAKTANLEFELPPYSGCVAADHPLLRYVLDSYDQYIYDYYDALGFQVVINPYVLRGETIVAIVYKLRW